SESHRPRRTRCWPSSKAHTVPRQISAAGIARRSSARSASRCVRAPSPRLRESNLEKREQLRAPFGLRVVERRLAVLVSRPRSSPMLDHTLHDLWTPHLDCGMMDGGSLYRVCCVGPGAMLEQPRDTDRPLVVEEIDQ